MVSILKYDPKYIESFRNLNLRWISHYFAVESMDLYQLEHPDQTVIAAGGEIFFAVDAQDDKVVMGTVAVIPYGGEDSYEIIKMAVDPGFQGKGVGKQLMDASVAWCKEKKAKQIWVLTNTLLEPAVNLYKRSGFKVTHEGAHPDYERCNIVFNMIL